ncbi:7-cyano-7-deazaguanine synthase QueC [Granulosicoccaceae sp. 1_MG-2023]|nr:7-cyano-7-deazaguanine synthase QueC [Granulosicoccaceae sp. 1_MG-2023]
MKTLVICSGGLDSVTLAWHVAASAQLHSLISFDYGQRHRRELLCAADCARDLGVPHRIVDLNCLTALLGDNALTGERAVPHGHYNEQSMKQTVVPNRNAIMMTIAFAAAASGGADAVALAVHGGDHFIYPDCRPGFIDAFAQMQQAALDGMADITLQAPFVDRDKAAIVQLGAELGVPFAATRSCYEAGELHCGRCGTCVERREAFALAGVDDPTTYQDPDYWKTAVAAAAQERS